MIKSSFHHKRTFTSSQSFFLFMFVHLSSLLHQMRFPSRRSNLAAVGRGTCESSWDLARISPTSSCLLGFVCDNFKWEPISEFAVLHRSSGLMASLPWLPLDACGHNLLSCAPSYGR
mmetsp:Transcript_15973/g.53487  ORF Transcript_15973/g.53487 Transcript_15973/m.53487 type:complete len:117 (-) Transcript_15973:1255-1605(-)